MVYNGLARAAREHVATECRYGAVLGRGHGCRALLVRGHLGARSTGAGAKPQVFAHGGAVLRVEQRGSTDHRISGGPNRRVTLGPVVALTTHTPGGVPLLIIGPDSDPGL